MFTLFSCIFLHLCLSRRGFLLRSSPTAAHVNLRGFCHIVCALHLDYSADYIGAVCFCAYVCVFAVASRLLTIVTYVYFCQLHRPLLGIHPLRFSSAVTKVRDSLRTVTKYLDALKRG